MGARTVWIRAGIAVVLAGALLVGALVASAPANPGAAPVQIADRDDRSVRAAVDETGDLNVTGTVDVGEVTGKVEVDEPLSVDGTLGAFPGRAASPLQRGSLGFNVGGIFTERDVALPVEGLDPAVSVAVTSLTFSNEHSKAVPVETWVFDRCSGDPSVASRVVEGQFVIPAGATVHMPYPQPLVLSARDDFQAEDWCPGFALGPSFDGFTNDVSVGLVGYTIQASP